MMGVTTAPLAKESVATLELHQGGGAAPSPRWAGRFEIRDRIGTGGMAMVFCAHDTVLGREVAIKVLRSGAANAARRDRLLDEARALARLQHPNVIPILDVGVAEEGVFVVMPLVENGTLRHWMAGPRSFDVILDAFVAAGRGLAATHAADLVHRDFKPDNVLLGGAGEIYVADFGLARCTGPQPTSPAMPPALTLQSQSGAVAGTPVYMAPEQLRGQPTDARADQFSFCVSLWEGLYGQRPFPDPSREDDDALCDRIDAITTGPQPPRRSDRPAWIARLLLRGLAVDRDRRWPSMQALLDAIAVRRTRRQRWRQRVFDLGVVAVVSAFVVAALIPVARPTPPPRAYPIKPVDHIDDLRAAAIAPDGTRYFVSGDALMSQHRGRDRILAEHGIRAPIAVSPDGQRLLVGLEGALVPTREIGLVDVATGQLTKLPKIGEAAFMSDREVVVTDARQRSIAVVSLDAPEIVTRQCDVPGDYTFLWHPRGLPDGTIFVQTQSVEFASSSLVMLDPSCRATQLTTGIIDYALSDAGTVVALVKGDRVDEIVELALDGRAMSHRRVIGSLGGVLGRRAGVDHVMTHTARTELVRIIDDTAPQRVLSLDHDASLYPSPDGNVLVRIQHDRRPQLPGQLWVSALQNLKRSRCVLDNATTAGWSPSGHMLAVLVDDGPVATGEPGAPAKHQRWLVILDATLEEIERIAVHAVDPEAAPVWLDEQRIAVRSADRKRYHWHSIGSVSQGEIGDERFGSMLWLTRGPDGTLAMWRMGPPGEITARTEHLWIQPPGGALAPVHVDEAVHQFLVPSWSRAGELLVRSLQTGVVSRVDLATGALAPIAELPPTPQSQPFDDHIVELPDGQRLAVTHEIGADLGTVGP